MAPHTMLNRVAVVMLLYGEILIIVGHFVANHQTEVMLQYIESRPHCIKHYR